MACTTIPSLVNEFPKNIGISNTQFSCSDSRWYLHHMVDLLVYKVVQYDIIRAIFTISVHV